MAITKGMRYVYSDGETVGVSKDIPEGGFLLRNVDGSPFVMKKYDVSSRIERIMEAFKFIGKPNHAEPTTSMYFAEI